MELPIEVRSALDQVWSGKTPDSVESARLDFKEDARTIKESCRVALDTALCLANTVGGFVVFGLDDDVAGPNALVGSTVDPATVRRFIHDNSRPRLLVDADEATYRDVRLLVVVVHADHDLYSDTKGRAPHRAGTTCVGMDPATQHRLREERRGFDPSGVAVGDLPVEEGALNRARQRLRASLRPERSALAKLSDVDLMRALGVTDSAGRILEAGRRLVGVDGTSLIYQYRESPGGEPNVVERMSASLLTVYDRVTELVRLRRQSTPVTLPDGQQLQIEDFPELAVREAIGNALIHRDYRLAGAVVVEHSPSVLTVTSPGPLVAGVTVQNILTHPSKPRNRALAAAVRTLELAEEVGRGVDRMYREMIRSGRPSPAIEATFEQVRVALVGGAPDLHVARYVAQLEPSVRDDTDAMIVLLRLCSSRTVTASSIAPLLQKSAAEAEASLRHLSSEPVAMIEPTRQSARSAHPNYRFREAVVRQLGSTIPYARHTSDEIDRRVIAHVQEYARITNATVRNLFNVGTQRANQILAGLVERELLTKTSKAQRGPSVEYGPGARFPPPARRRRPRSLGTGSGRTDTARRVDEVLGELGYGR